MVGFRRFNTYVWDSEEKPEPEHNYHLFAFSKNGDKLSEYRSSSLDLWRGFFPVAVNEKFVVANIGGFLTMVNVSKEISETWAVSDYYVEEKLSPSLEKQFWTFGGYPIIIHSKRTIISIFAPFTMDNVKKEPVSTGSNILVYVNFDGMVEHIKLLEERITSNIIVGKDLVGLAGCKKGIILFDITNGQILEKFHLKEPVLSVSLAPDGFIAATKSHITKFAIWP